MRVSIIIPFLNEIAIIEKALAMVSENLERVADSCGGVRWEVCLVDSGSMDGSGEWGRDYAEQKAWQFVDAKLVRPSIGRALNSAIKDVESEFVVFLPMDVEIPLAALNLLAEVLVGDEVQCGGFIKAYSPQTLFLKTYVGVQNIFRSKLLKNLVWTNVIFGRRQLFVEEPLPEDGFLEDVILSDRLKHKNGWRLLNSRVLVSSRKYYPERVGKRIFVNLLIMFLYRTRLVGINRLKLMYQKN